MRGSFRLHDNNNNNWLGLRKLQRAAKFMLDIFIYFLQYCRRAGDSWKFCKKKYVFFKLISSNYCSDVKLVLIKISSVQLNLSFASTFDQCQRRRLD